MKSAAKKIEVAEITTTYVWRATLRHVTNGTEVELLVLCDEQLMGEKFTKSVADTLEAYKNKGLVRWEEVLSDYSICAVENLGLAAGSVKMTSSAEGVAVGSFREGVPMMIDPERVTMLAGLTRKPETATAKAESATRKKRTKQLEEMEKFVEATDLSLKDVLLDTATSMVRDGDLDNVPTAMLEQAIAAARVVNPDVLNPRLPMTPEQLKEFEEIKKSLVGKQPNASDVKKD